MVLFNKSLIKSDFDKAAASYNEKAVLQKKTAAELVNYFGYKLSNKKVLDVGSGTGFVREFLKQNEVKTDLFETDISIEMCKISRKAGAKTICSDIEFPVFRDEAFDAVISSLCFQWLNDYKKTISDIKNLLKKNGYFIFSTFSEETLKELKNIFEENGLKGRVNSFQKCSDFIFELEKQGFKNINFYESKIIKYYNNFSCILNEIREVGAANKNSEFRVNSLSKSKLQKIEEEYKKKYSVNGQIFASWHISYIVAEKL